MDDVVALGIDLAWGPRGRTGLAVLDAVGRLAASCWVRTDDEIAGFVRKHAAAGAAVVAAVDAPLIVPNQTGRRSCEAELSRRFARFHAGAHPSNRSRPWLAEPRGAVLAARLGWSLDPADRPTPGRSVAIEVYPHPAMVVLFGLDRVIPYKNKPGRDLESMRAGHALLMDHMEQVMGPVLRLGGSPRWAVLREQVRTASTKAALGRAEDEVDAVVCAYLAWLWAQAPERMAVVGGVDAGYVVVPRPLPPERLSR